MPDALDRTFSVLTSTSNTHAVDVLIHALNVTDSAIQTRATAALMKRSSTRGHTELIRQLDSLSPDSRQELEKQSARIAEAAKQALLNGDADLRRNGLELVRTAESYKQIPTLLQMLESVHDDLRDEIVQSLHDLINRLYEHSRPDGGESSTEKYLRNAPQVRHHVLTELDRAVSHFERLVYPEDVVESILILGDPDNFAVRKVLLQSRPDCLDVAGDLLVTSRHPGVMQLILDFMSQNYPPDKILEAVERRDDAEFIAHLLRWFPQQLSPIQQKNFRQVESVVWLDVRSASLEIIPGPLQDRLVSFVRATGLPDDRKTEVQKWLVQHGSPEGRLAAAQVLTSLDKQETCGILVGSLHSDDEGVQAWATSQLRKQGVPDAFGLLIERLDSTSAIVRETAQGELESFNLDLMMDLYEQLDPVVCRRAGRLVEKIDPDCLSRLTRHLRDPVRSRRLRAARATLALGLQTKVFPALAAMLADEDAMVRRTAAEVLGHVVTAESFEALLAMRSDPSPRVREAADAAIELLKQQGLRTAVANP